MPKPAPPPSRASRLARLAGRALLAYIVLSLAIGIGIGFRNTNPNRKLPHTVATDLSPRAVTVDFRSEDGLRLEGYLAPPEPGRPVLVVQHGKRGNRDSLLPWSRVLAQAGYGVLSFDWRSHGRSDGPWIYHGAEEPKDLVAALALLASRPDTAGRPVGLYAVSLGAACTAMTAPRLGPEVRAMILDSPFGSLPRMAADRLRALGPLALGPRLALDAFSAYVVGAPTDQVVPELALQAFSPRPLLVFHGDADDVIPVSEGRSLVAAYPGPKELWETHGDGHAKARTTRTRDWMRHLATFFAAHLPGAPDPDAVLALTPEKIEEFAYLH